MKPKHIWGALLVMVALFVSINIRSEMRRTKPGEPGRLSGNAQVGDPQAVSIVEEAPPPVNDQTAADPMLIAPAAREQYLHANTSAPPVIEPILAPTPAYPSAYPSERRGKSRFTIVGGPEGVALVQSPQRGQ